MAGWHRLFQLGPEEGREVRREGKWREGRRGFGWCGLVIRGQRQDGGLAQTLPVGA